MEKEILKKVAEDFFSQFGERLEIYSARALGGGCISHAVRLDTNCGILFLKWNANVPPDLFVREAESLNELLKSDNDNLTFPKPLLAKPTDQLPGYLLTTFLEEGRSGNDDEKLGRGLAQLHQLKNTQFGFYHNNYCGSTTQDNQFKDNWVTFYTENRIGYLIRLISSSGGWSKADFHLSDQFMELVPKLIGHHPAPSLIHGDLWSGNYLYTITSPALIDPCACYCDREFEMGIMTMFGVFSQTVYDAYNEIYPLPAEWRERNPIYQLYHVLNHFYLFGGFYKNRALEIMKKYL